MAKTPRSVQKQAAEALKLQEQLNQPPVDPGLEEATSAIEEPAPVVAGGEVDKPVSTEQQPPLKSEELSKEQGVDWEKRFKGIKDLHDREVPKLRGELENAYSLIDNMKIEIEEMNAKILDVGNAPAPAKVDLELTDEEIEQYGDGWINMMTKIAGQSSSELAKQVVDLQKKLADVQQGQSDIKETVQVNTSRDFYSELGRVVKNSTGKDWKDINKDSEFHAYLSEIVPQTGKERQNFLLTAKNNLDVNATAQFFIDFAVSSSEETGALPDAEEPLIPEEIVQPVSSGGGDLPPINEAKVYTTDEVTMFYQDRLRGKYKGKEGEARDIEKDILAAGREGRIVEKRRYASA